MGVESFVSQGLPVIFITVRLTVSLVIVSSDLSLCQSLVDCSDVLALTGSSLVSILTTTTSYYCICSCHRNYVRNSNNKRNIFQGDMR